MLTNDPALMSSREAHGVQPAPEKVWVLQVETKHGVHITVHRTHQGAMDDLFNFVAEWWDQELYDHRNEPRIPEMPGDPEAAIEMYFNGCEHESWLLNESTVNP